MTVELIQEDNINIKAFGIPVKIDSKNKLITNKQAVAAFDPNTGTIYLKKRPTLLSSYHESYHANQFLGGSELQRRENLLYVDLHKETHTAVLVSCWNEKLEVVVIENRPSEFKKLAEEMNRKSNYLWT